MRGVLCWLAAVSLVLLQGGLNDAAAQGYPDKPVRVIVPFTPGGSTDHTGRIIAEAMSASLKQPFVVENRPGAAATIGIDLVAKSKPDGYTVGVSGVGATAIVPLLDPKLPYNPARDLEIVAGLSGVDSVFIARPDLKQNNIAEVLAFAKDNPEKISYATAGVTGPSHLAMEDLSQLAKVKMLHVPFAGDVPAITGVLTGDVSIGLVAIASATPFLTDGKLKALAAGGPKRLNEAVARGDVREKLENLGLKTMPGDAKWAQDFVAAEIAKNKRIIETTGVKRE